MAVLLGWDAESATGRSPLSNTRIAEMVATHPDVFRGFGAVDPLKGAAAFAGVHEAKRLGLGGISLHAAVAKPARDRRRLERICRYVARPPLATDRLEELPDGRLAVRLKTPWRDGTSHILMERSELIERLVPLITPVGSTNLRAQNVRPFAKLRWNRGCILICTWLLRP